MSRRSAVGGLELQRRISFDDKRYLRQTKPELLQSFRDKASEDIRNGKDSRVARRRLPKELWAVATRRLDQLHRVLSLEELRVPPGNRLEALVGERRGQHSIRINDQYRICFVWGREGPEQIEVTDYH